MSSRTAFAALAVATMGSIACSVVAGLPSDYSLAPGTDASSPGPDAAVEGLPDVAAPDACTGCGAIALATGENGPKEIAVAGSSLYWTASQAVRTCTLPDCLDAADFCPASDARGLALSSDNAYWAERGLKQISWAALSGGCQDAGAAGLAGFIPDAGNNLDGLTVDPTYVYWVATSDNDLLRAGLDGTGAATLGDRSYLNGPSWLAVDGALVYVASQYSQDNGVTVTDTALGGHKTVAHGGQTLRLALDATNIYFTDRDEASGSGAVRYAPKVAFDGDAGTLIASDSSGPVGLVVDPATRVIYWANEYDATVLKCPIDSCTIPTVIASGQGQPWGVAVDGQYVYWTNRNNDGRSSGQVMRAPK